MHAALKHLMSEDDRFELVFVAFNCDDFLRNAATNPIDVGVIGWIIGPCDGRFILDHLNGQEHPPRIVVYTGDESKIVPSQVMSHGGAAFVSKSEQPAVLLDTVAAVAAGRMVFPYIDVRSIYDNPLSTLTRREMEVLADLASGRTNKQIARDLGVSLNTIKFHVRNLFQKLGVNSRGQAIAMYLKS
ncbi:MAG: response regulator transcription factor [Xanthomonadales bacterium]|nr:response regulator transcription factor [Gammaproteobacteria bacterium]MBT8053194.1 response regulator transcription factor [Gammaproteobacteria bacterium]NND58355.1 response regulator transcription factor [Xanthomonadales bacterium]NNK50233.1 response regulator transcription factor [Xanthomonadales bacterium]